MNKRNLLVVAMILSCGALAAVKRASAKANLNVEARIAGGKWEAKPTTVLDDIADFRPADVKLDRFGGLSDVSLGKPSGFFRVSHEKDRWALVDPDGNFFYSVGVNSVNTGGSKGEPNLVSKYKNKENWATETSKMLRGDGFNTLGCWSDYESFTNEGSRMPYAVQMNFASAYAKKKRVTVPAFGHTGFPNECMPIFDPEFAPFCQERARDMATKLKDDPWLFGYFTDNELPFRNEAMKLYLELPEADAGHLAAKKWQTEHPDDKDGKQFSEHVAETYFATVCDALRKADPNHLIIGSRFHGRVTNFDQVFRAAGRHLDVISVNYYHAWSPDYAKTAKWAQWSGRPYLVTEWYAMTADADVEVTHGAGFIVKTEADQGHFYQNFTLGLALDANCVGWHWFKYSDSSVSPDSDEAPKPTVHKGVVNAEFLPYPKLTQMMAELNKQVYPLLEYFNRKGKPAP